jgi:hypothetical protein
MAMCEDSVPSAWLLRQAMDAHPMVGQHCDAADGYRPASAMELAVRVRARMNQPHPRATATSSG